jgi:hypothetical protein
VVYSVVSSDVDNVTLTDNNNGTWTLTPKANFSGDGVLVMFNLNLGISFAILVSGANGNIIH